LEEKRDAYLQDLFGRFQALVRGFMMRRRVKKRLYRHEAIGVVQENLIVYSRLESDPWWRLYVKMKPLLTNARAMEQEKAKQAAISEMEAKIAKEVCLFI
jgi:myosin heavy chain 9/10/11/14